jgi:REP element-mobilizing transposase RayT
MARKLRVEFEGAIYHVTLRGAERRRLFDEERDRERFLAQLASGVELDGVRLYLFCLMTNHVHLVLKTPHANLGRFMHRLQTAYTVYYNLRHQRAGHLMQGRYKAILVEGDEYVLKLSRYVHLNPVQAGAARRGELQERIQALRAYGWSSYQSYIGAKPRLAYVEHEPVLAMMDSQRGARQKEYRKFVEAGLAETDEEFAALMKRPGWAIGSEEFRARVRDAYCSRLLKESRPEDAAFRRQGRYLAPEQVRRTVLSVWGAEERDLRRRSRNDWLRPVMARMLCQYSGLTQRAVAGALGVKTGVAVCIQLRNLSGAIPADRALRERVDRIQAELQQQLDGSSATDLS